MMIAARNAFLMDGARPVEVGYITSSGNVLVQLDWAFDSSNWLTAKHTIIGSVMGASDSGSPRYICRLLCASIYNAPNDMPQEEKSGFHFYASNPDRRNTLNYGYQGWWNVANGDNYSYNQFHTFVFQHSSTPRQFGSLYRRDGITVRMVASSRGGNYDVSNRDPSYNNRKICLFGAYDYLTSDGFHYYDVNSWKFGGWKIELNNQVIHDYVPAMKGGALGVWDKATGTFFAPQGTGTLTSGDR